MFVGHYGVSFAIKRAAPRISLGTLFLAVQLLDVLFSAFVLLGIEKMARSGRDPSQFARDLLAHLRHLLIVQTTREHFRYAPAVNPSGVALESLTIAPDVLPHHFTARAVILDLQPADIVKAIAAVEALIAAEYPCFHTTGWRGASDGIRLYFTAWTTR